jgi:hypothetical protein
VQRWEFQAQACMARESVVLACVFFLPAPGLAGVPHQGSAAVGVNPARSRPGVPGHSRNARFCRPMEAQMRARAHTQMHLCARTHTHMNAVREQARDGAREM